MVPNPFKKLLGNLPGTADPATRKVSPAGQKLQSALNEVGALKRAGRSADAADMLEHLFRKVEAHPIVGYRLVATLLDLGQYERVLTLPAARPYNSRDFAIAEFLTRVDVHRVDAAPIEPGPACDELGYVTMVKDEADILLFNLVWHYHLGIRKFFVIDNNSADRTDELIRIFMARFPEATVLTLRDPVVAHFQSQKVTGACHFMRSLWPELTWLALLDGDEFLFPTVPFQQLLAGIDAESDAIIVPKSMYRFTPEENTGEQDYFFRRMTHRMPLGHVSSKIIVRASAATEIGQGNHRIAELDKLYTTARYTACPELTMKEYPVRSLQHYIRKAVTGGKAVQAAKEAGFAQVGGGHWAGQFATYQAHGAAGLERKFAADVVSYGARATIADPFPLDQVMDHWLPDWRTLLPLPVQG